MDSNPSQTQITHDFTPFLPGLQHRPHREVRRTRFRRPIARSTNRRYIQRRRRRAGKQRLRQNIPPQNHRRDPKKLPLLIYIHGGGFSLESAFSSLYHNYANSLASESRSVVVSIEYRLAPEHPIPAYYDDSYAVVKWVDSHSRVGGGPDPWLNEYAEFQRVYVGGDSAGANIAHDMVIRASNSRENGLGIKFAGLILVHSFFGSGKPDKLWDFICPETPGSNDRG